MQEVDVGQPAAPLKAAPMFEGGVGGSAHSCRGACPVLPTGSGWAFSGPLMPHQVGSPHVGLDGDGACCLWGVLQPSDRGVASSGK